MCSKKVAVIGFGSLNGDDQAGWLVIDKLQQEIYSDDVMLFKSKADGADWFPVVENASEIIFVDAVKSGVTAGTIHKLKNQQECRQLFSSSSHAISIFESIELAETLGYLTSPYVFFGIEIESSENLTLQVKQSIDRAVDEIKTRIENC